MRLIRRPALENILQSKVGFQPKMANYGKPSKLTEELIIQVLEKQTAGVTTLKNVLLTRDQFVDRLQVGPCTTFLAAVPIATTLARDTSPVSSTNRQDIKPRPREHPLSTSSLFSHYHNPTSVYHMNVYYHVECTRIGQAMVSG